jgi:hypothetical protein
VLLERNKSMKLNIGTVDQKLRIALAIAIGVILLIANIGGTVMIILSVVAGVLLLTGAFNFCPLYSVCGLSTKKDS